MTLVQEFVPIALADLHRECAVRKIEGWRFIQTHAVKTDEAVDIYYSFMKDGKVENLKVEGVTKQDAVPSVTDLFLAAFVFENEARELFGVDMRDIAIDFSGAMYAPAESEPMTFMSPEQKAAREKARKAQAAKQAKEDAPVKADSVETGGARVFVMTPERRQRLDAKLANMAPDKVAKVEAALKAREAEAAAAASGAKAVPSGDETAKLADKQAAPKAESQEPVEEAKNPKPVDSVLEGKIAIMDSEKAAKVRAAIAARNGEQVDGAKQDAAAEALRDAELEAKLAIMGEEKAAKVRAALAAKAAKKGGE